jgi:hypothetical protein
MKVRLGSYELKEVFRLRALALRRNRPFDATLLRVFERRVTLGSANIRCAQETVNSGMRPKIDLDRMRVTDWLVKL